MFCNSIAMRMAFFNLFFPRPGWIEVPVTVMRASAEFKFSKLILPKSAPSTV